MQTFKSALKILEESKEFAEWKKNNKGHFLSYGFIIKDEDDWKIGFFNPKTEKLTSFNISLTICLEPNEEEAFKKPETKVKELEAEKINIDSDKALDIADEFQKSHYPREQPIKTILIVQNTGKHETIWNITLVTQHFNTLNIKIDAINGKIIEHKLESILSLGKK